MPRALLMICFLYLLLGGAYSTATPPFEASDEASHYAFVKYLADGHGLPVQGQPTSYRYLQEGSQPPLYYLLAAASTLWIETGTPESVYRVNPHAQTGKPAASHNKNLVLHRPEERWSWGGALGAVRLLRLLGVLLGLGTVGSAYLLGRALAPDSQVVGLGAAALAAFNPMALFIAASVNDDALMTPLGAAALLLLVRARVGQQSARHLALLGLVLGAAALTKLSGLIFPPLAVGVLCWGRAPRQWAGLTAVPVGMAALLAGWWYVRNFVLYGDPSGLSAMLRVAGSRRLSLEGLLAEMEGAFDSFWGVFGTFNIIMPQAVYIAFAVLALGGLAGVFLAWRRASARRPVYIVLLGAVLLNFVALTRWTTITLGSQGRLLFPTLAATAALLALGLAALAGPRWAPRLIAAAGAVMFLVAASVPFVVIPRAYPAPNLLTSEASMPRNTYVRVGGYAELLGYELEPASLQAGDDLIVTLYWRGLSTAPKDYSLFIHLRDAEGRTLVQLDSYPGGGTYPTTWWRPGDLLRERYRTPIVFDVAVPRRADLVIGWYDLDGFQVLPTFDEVGRPAFSRIATVRLAPANWRPQQASAEGTDYGGRLRLANAAHSLKARPGERLKVNLQWYALQPPERDWQLFVHLVPAGQRVRPLVQVDAPLGENAYPSGLWPAGEAVTQTLELALPAGLPPDSYDLLVGLYDVATGERAATPSDPDGTAVWASVKVD